MRQSFLYAISLICALPIFAEDVLPPLPTPEASTAPTLLNMQLEAPVLTGQFPVQIKESSGLVKSQRYPKLDIFWTHGDSGNTPSIFAVTSKGKVLREIEIPTAKNIDWEDMTMDAKGRILIGDIGDNKEKRQEIVIYRLPEPDVLDTTSKAQSPEVFKFIYPKEQGPQNAESLFIMNGDAYVLTKNLVKTRCYKLPMPDKAPETAVVAQPVDESNTLTLLTGAALSTDGKHLALVSCISIHVLDLPTKDGQAQLSLKAVHRNRRVWLGQTEAIAWDGNDLVLTTEGGAVYRVKDAAIRPKE